MRNSKLFEITTQPTLKMYKQLNKMHSQRSVSIVFFLVLSCILGVFGIFSIVRYTMGIDSATGGLIKGILWVLVNVAYVAFYLKGHELLAEKSMRLQGKDAYLEIYSTFYEDRVDVRTSKTKGTIKLSSINRVYEDSQYYYLSYDDNKVTKSYLVVDKLGFTLGDPNAFKTFIEGKVAYNKAYTHKIKKDNTIKS